MRSPELGPRSPEVAPEPTTRHVVAAQAPSSLIFELSADISFNQEELDMLSAAPCIGYEYMPDDKLIILTLNRNYSWTTVIHEFQQVLLCVAERTGRKISFVNPLAQTIVLPSTSANETPKGENFRWGNTSPSPARREPLEVQNTTSQSSFGGLSSF